MKRNIITIILSVVLVLLLFTATVWYKNLSAEFIPSPETSSSPNADAAPDFTVLDAEGNEVKLSDHFGTPIVLNFWATWCGPCKFELPAFDTVFGEYGDEVQFMMVNLTDGVRDTVEGVMDFVSTNGYNLPIYLDTDLDAANAYSVYSIPRTFFINSDGTISAKHAGPVSEEALRNYIEKLN